MTELDMENRDPNNLNDNLKVAFEDVFGEPDATHSVDCVWKLAYTCFNCWLGLCYKLSTLCCGICLAAQWGWDFAQTAVCHIWWITPSLRMLEMNCGVLRRINETICGCCLDPCCISCGKIFSAFEKH